MSETAITFQEAEALRKDGQYAKAGAVFHRLWDEQGDPSNGWRYAHCLRKAGYPQAAVQVIEQVVARHPDDQWAGFERGWCLYETLVKPARAEGRLGKLLQAGQKMLQAGATGLALQHTVFAIVQAAKDKGQWALVSEWCDRLDRQALSAEPREMGGRRVVSEREQWYFAKVKSLVQLEQWDETRELALEAGQAFPRQRDFARWAARALAGQGQLSEAIAELETLAQRGRPDWYLLRDLAELKLQDGQAQDAFRVACQAALAPGEDKAKVGLFVLVAQIAYQLQRFDVATRHAALSRLVRTREEWSVPAQVKQIESEARSAYEQTDQQPLDLPDEVSALAALCRRDWEQVVPPELRPQKKRRPRPQPKPEGAVHSGRIKMYKEKNGYGFIESDDGGEDLFFHISNVQGVETPEPGTAVQYRIAEGRKGPNAVDVQAVASEQ